MIEEAEKDIRGYKEVLKCNAKLEDLVIYRGRSEEEVEIEVEPTTLTLKKLCSFQMAQYT